MAFPNVTCMRFWDKLNSNKKKWPINMVRESILNICRGVFLMVYCYETFGHKELKYKYFVKLNYLFFFLL